MIWINDADAHTSTSRPFDSSCIVTQSTLTNWTFAAGSVVVAIEGNSGVPCDVVCIDTDGSGSPALLDMSTNETFEFLAGETPSADLDVADAIATRISRPDETICVAIPTAGASRTVSAPGIFSFAPTRTATAPAALFLGGIAALGALRFRRG